METMKRRETGTVGTVSKSGPERVFFIVDRSRLKEETDELKDAVVVYMPEGDLKKPSLEQRCSQLIGISLLMFNFTNKLPKFIKLKSHGFAIRSLGDTPCVMGLQSKFDEPKSSVIQYLDRIHDFFMFSYSSLDYVMEMSRGDWEIFTIQMTTIFQSILDFTFRETHTLPSMFNPLPYVKLDSEKGGSKLFLHAHRLLRNIQLKNSVIGGCLFYNKELLCSQLPPDISEKLLFVANGGVDLNRRSILDDQEMPESVWIIDIYLTPEELAILHQIQRPHRELTSFYSNLTPNSGLARTVFASSSRNEELISELLPPAPPPPIYRADSGGSADFVTISYNSVSYSAAHATSKVSPLKRPKNNRRFSHSYEELNRDRLYEDLTYSTIEKVIPKVTRERASLESSEEPPPLPPPRPSEAPPLPSRKGAIISRPEDDEDFAEPPPPLPPRPGAPPIPKRNTGPVPPPRSVSVRQEEVPPPLPLKSQWLQGEDMGIQEKDNGEKGSEEIDGGRDPISPNGIYGTPSASISEALINNELSLDRRDSEGSDRFGTPSSNSPVPMDFNSLSLSTITSDPSNNTAYLTPLVNSLNSPENSKLDIYGTLERSFNKEEEEKDKNKDSFVESEKTDISVETKDERQEHIGVKDNDSEIDRKISSTSNASSDLIMTKGTSEPGSCDSTLLRKKLHELSSEDLTHGKSSPDLVNCSDGSTCSLPFPPSSLRHKTNQHSIEEEETEKDEVNMDNYLDTQEQEEEEGDESGTFRRISSPHDFTDSPSENEDQLGSLGLGAILRQNPNIKRPRAESWMGTQATFNKGGTDNDEMTQRAMWYERRTIYIQKCVNTVVAIVTDTNLPDDKKLVQDLWKSMLTHLLHINNTVQSCIVEKEELYVTGESVRTETGTSKTYQAVYSGLTGNCEVSSSTAPYQFRHAARRAHQEYITNPSLRQLSLCKDFCRMYCQNTMGRESYIHTNRTIVNDSLATHCALERHAKVLTKQQKRRDPIDYSIAPNLSFL